MLIKMDNNDSRRVLGVNNTTGTGSRIPPPPHLNNRPKCELDSRNVVSLADILKSFHAPISEEYAWALTYQCAKCGQSVLANDEEREICHLITQPEHLLVHKDGQIHPHSFISQDPASPTISTEDAGTSSSGTGQYRDICRLT